MTDKIHKTWQPLIEAELKKPYGKKLQDFVRDERKTYKVYPAPNDTFNALKNTPLDEVKAVILGQDPYHGAGQAHGLSFSVQDGVKIPPSLRNIFAEYADDLDLHVPQSGNLSKWAKQGVLLLNTILTVREASPLSHANMGWEELTHAIIDEINVQHDHVVFILWGNYALDYSKNIDASRHNIISGPHPSPLSAHRGFFGSKPFSRANQYLIASGREPINWNLN